jgi:hypothetical protein
VPLTVSRIIVKYLLKALIRFFDLLRVCKKIS